MVDKTLAMAYEQACRKAECSRNRLEYAEQNADRFTEEDIKQLKEEATADEKELYSIQKQLQIAISDIPNVLVKRLADDHYLKRIKVSELSGLYKYSKSSIKRYLKMSRG